MKKRYSTICCHLPSVKIGRKILPNIDSWKNDRNASVNIEVDIENKSRYQQHIDIGSKGNADRSIVHIDTSTEDDGDVVLVEAWSFVVASAFCRCLDDGDDDDPVISLADSFLNEGDSDSSDEEERVLDVVLRRNIVDSNTCL